MKRALLVLLLLIPSITFSQAIDLFQQFNGRYDFTAFGNTLNEAENGGGSGCTILTQSTANLTLFPNQTFVSAHLYWAGPGNGDFDVELNGTPVSAQRTFALTAATGLDYFAAYADVSPLITGTGAYTLSELDLTGVIGPYCGGTTNFGGWSIIVIFEDPALTLNQISLFDGLDYVSAQQQSLEIILNNIDVSTDELAKIGFLAWEGDRNIANNETLLINGTLIDNPPLNPGDNAFNGTNSYTGSDQLFNMDLDFYDLEGIVQPGDTQVTINLTSSQDFVMVNNLITSVNSEIPDATIVIDNIGVLCQNRDLDVGYTVFNVNSTAPLEANTPIAFYINNILVGQTQTVTDIPIDGSESGFISVNIPIGTPLVFDLRAVVDDIGDGTGIVPETNEENNEFIQVVDLLEAAQFLGPNIDSCIGMTVTLDTGITNPLFTFQWFFNGVLIPGAGDPTLDVTVDGTYSCIASEGACDATDSVDVVFNPQPMIEGEPLDLFQCDDGVSTGVFDLTENEDDILGAQDPALFIFKYYETFLDSQNDTNAILGPTTHLIVPPSPQTIFVRVEDLSGTCTAFTDFEIYFTVAVAGEVALPFYLCDQDEDGVEPIDLPLEFDLLILNGEDEMQYNITYHNTQAEADSNTNPLPVPYLVNAPGETVFARIENLDDIRCYDTEDIELIVEERPIANETPDPLVLCDNDGFSEFDLTLADLDITGGNPDLSVSYHGTLLDAQNNLLPILGLYENDDIYNDSVWARVESLTTSCYETVELFLEVREIPDATTPAEPLRLCDDGVADGFTFFDLTVVEPEVLGGLSPTEYDFYYYVLESDAIVAGDVALTAPDFSQAIADPTNFLNSSNPQTIFILMVGNTTSTNPPNPNGASGCYDIVPLTLIVDPLPLDLGPFELFLCDDEASGSTTDEISIFDLTTQNNAVTGGDTSLTVTWYASVADEMADIPIPDPTAYANTVTPETIVGRITTEFDCSITITMTLTVLPNPIPNFTPTPLEVCDDNDDGIVGGFDLPTKDVEIIGPEVDVSVLYYEDLEDAKAGLAGTEITGLYTNIIPFSQIVYARVTRDVPPAILPCYTIVELQLNVIALPDMPDANFINPMQSCDDSGDGQAIFDLTQNDLPVIGAQDPADFLPITYYISELDAGVPTNAIATPGAFLSGGQTIWVRLESTVTGCARISSFQLVVGSLPTIGAPNDLFLCDDEVNGSTSTDGLSTFDLTLNTELIQQGDFTIDVRYYKDAADQLADIAIMNPETYQNIVSPQQEIFVSGYNLEGCPAVSSFFINVDPNPNAIEATPLVACDDNGDGIYSFFDLTSKDVEISNGETDVVVSYYETEVAANIGSAGTALSSPYTNIDPFVQVIFARVTRNVLGSLACYTVVPLELRVEDLPLAPDGDFMDPLRKCDDDGDGFVSFDLTVNNTSVYAGQDPADFDAITYYETELDAIDGTNAIGNPTDYTNIQTPDQPLWVRLARLDTGCARITEFALRVDGLPVIGVGPFEMLLCDDEQSGSSTDTFSIFDLTQNNDIITLEDPSLSVIYYATADDQTNDIPIADPTAYQNVTNPQDIFVTVFSEQAPDCSVDTNVILRVLPNPLAVVPEAYRLCDEVDSRDGFTEFDLSTRDVEIIGGQPDVGVLYYLTQEDAEAGLLGTELPSLYTNETANEQVIYARVTNAVPPAERACYDVVALTLIVDPLPDDSALVSDETACQVPFVGIETIILDDKDLEVLNGQSPDDFEVYYFEDLVDAESMNIGVAISSSTPYPYNTTERTIYIGIMNNDTGCYIYYIEDSNELSFVLVVKEGANATPPLDPYTICDNFEENDGIGQFTLISDPANPTDLDAQADALALEILNGQDPAFFELSFHETVASAQAGTDAVGNTYINIINPQTLYVRVTNIIDPLDTDACFAISSLTLNVDQLPNSVLEQEYRLCVDSNGNPIPQEEGADSPPLIDTGLNPSLYSFLWTYNGEILPNEIGPSLVALQGGAYTVTITDLERGCEATFSTTVIVSSPPITFDAQVVSGAFSSDHTIEATATGEGTYVFELDGGPSQDSGVFTGVEPGNHIITIRDVNGCGSVTIEVGVIDYPRFMTPNQDGFHDTWNIIGIANGDPSAKIYIFDKFGKLLKQISPLGEGWDGTYNGNPLPSSDYWFRVEYKEDDTTKEFRGHFTLKR